MKKFKALLLSVAVLVVSGCALLDKITPAADPQEVMTEMITNMQGMTASTFSVDSTIKYKDEVTGSSADADIKVTGKSDLVDTAKPNLNLNVDLAVDSMDATMGAMKGSAKFVATSVDGEFYFKLDDLVAPAAYADQIASFVSMYKGNWYKLPAELMPDAVKDTTDEEDTMAKTKKEQIEKLVSEAQMFDVLESSEENGQYVYTVDVNVENLKTLSKEIAKVEGTPMTDADLVMLDDIFKNYTYTATLYINKDSRFLDKVVLTVGSKDTAVDLNVDLTVAFSNHNKAQTITAPESAEDFNPMALMGLGMMLEGSQGVNLNEDDSTDFDLENINLDDLEADMAELDAMMEGLEVETTMGE